MIESPFASLITKSVLRVCGLVFVVAVNKGVSAFFVTVNPRILRISEQVRSHLHLILTTNHVERSLRLYDLQSRSILRQFVIIVAACRPRTAAATVEYKIYFFAN